MVRKLRRASIVFWILSGGTLLSCLSLLTYDYATGVNFGEFINAIVYSVINLLKICWSWLREEPELFSIEKQMWTYVLFMIPGVFASIAVVLRMIAKAFEEQTISIMNLMNEKK